MLNFHTDFKTITVYLISILISKHFWVVLFIFVLLCCYRKTYLSSQLSRCVFLCRNLTLTPRPTVIRSMNCSPCAYVKLSSPRGHLASSARPTSLLVCHPTSVSSGGNDSEPPPNLPNLPCVPGVIVRWTTTRPPRPVYSLRDLCCSV